MLLVFGFASIVVGALFMVVRGNFKRLFAYSSIEHMGIIAVALGFGGVLGDLRRAAAHAQPRHRQGRAVPDQRRCRLALPDAAASREVRGLLGALPFSGGVLLLASLAIPVRRRSGSSCPS